MSDDLPPLGWPRRPGMAASPQALEAVVAEGRRRLRRYALMTTGTTASLVGLFVGLALVGGSGQEDALILTPASPPSGVFPSPRGTIAPAPDAPAVVSSSRGPTAVGRPLPVAQPTPRPAASGRPVPLGPEAAPGRAGLRTTPYREDPQTVYDSFGCTVDDTLDGQPSGERLCTRARASTNRVRAGSSVDVEVVVCNADFDGHPVELRFPTGREHDLYVDEGVDTVWTWSRHHTFPQGAHTRVVPGGECLEWVTTWRTRDDEGRVVGPGRYSLHPSVEVNGRTASFFLQVQVEA